MPFCHKFVSTSVPNFYILTEGRTPAVWGLNMSCSGIVRLHATLAEATFLSLGKSYGRLGNNVRFERFGHFKNLFSFFIFLRFCSYLHFCFVSEGRTPAVWGFNMSCSGIVRPHATLAEATFLLLGKSYEIFLNISRNLFLGFWGSEFLVGFVCSVVGKV